MDDRSDKLRAFFASHVCADLDPRLMQAFADVRREPFVGPGPWWVVSGTGYIKTPDDDPAFIYQDTLVALDREREINIGEPSAHARWLDALALREGETVLQIGAGTGYYTAIIAHLVGTGGRVHAYEIDQGFAARAGENLKSLPQVDVQRDQASWTACRRLMPSMYAQVVRGLARFGLTPYILARGCYSRSSPKMGLAACCCSNVPITVQSGLQNLSPPLRSSAAWDCGTPRRAAWRRRFRRAWIRCDRSEWMTTRMTRVGLPGMAGGSRPQRPFERR